MGRLRGVTVETLVPQNARKRAALEKLKHHVASNWENGYGRLPAASAYDEEEILSSLRTKGELLDVKLRLRQARVKKREVVHAMGELIDGRGNNRMLAVSEKKAIGLEVWRFLRKINRPRRDQIS